MFHVNMNFQHGGKLHGSRESEVGYHEVSDIFSSYIVMNMYLHGNVIKQIALGRAVTAQYGNLLHF